MLKQICKKKRPLHIYTETKPSEKIECLKTIYIKKSVELPGLCQIMHTFFIRLVLSIGSCVKMQNDFVSFTVSFQHIYVKWPFNRVNQCVIQCIYHM